MHIDYSPSESSSEGKSEAESPQPRPLPALSPSNCQIVEQSSDAPNENKQSQTVEGLFGDTAELSSS